jgi:hypothetical protein
VDELCKSRSRRPNAIDKVRLAQVAARQAGRVAAFQFTHLGIARATVYGWVRSGYLHEVAPRVYAVGYVAPSREGELWSAVL